MIERVLPALRELRAGAWTLRVEASLAEPLLAAGLREALEEADGLGPPGKAGASESAGDREFPGHGASSGAATAGAASGGPRSPQGGLPDTPSGRGTHRRLVLKDGRAVILRRYRHGGWLAPLTGERFLGTGRFRREFDLGRWAWAAGVPTPRPVAVGWRAMGLTRRGCLATLEVPGARDLLAVFSDAPSPEARRAIARAAARAVRGLHNAGIAHADLHLKNILLEEAPERPATEGAAGPRAWIIDLDLARRGEAPLPLRARIANLARLARSAEKHRRAGLALGEAEAEAFCETYFGDDREGRRAAERASKIARLRARVHGRT